jgi:hypothetical protein
LTGASGSCPVLSCPQFEQPFQVFQVLLQRLLEEADSRSLDWPVIARSAIISPTTLLNLNPCPENPAEIETCGKSGCTSRMIAKRPAMISLTNWELHA